MRPTGIDTKRQLQRGDAGLTLIELMVASGALAVALGIMFGSLVTLNVMGQVAEGRTRASTLLAGVLEEVRTLSYQQMLVYTPNPIECEGLEVGVLLEAFDSDGMAISLPVQTDTSASGTLPDLPNPLEVRATVLWSRGDGRTYAVSSSTFHGR